MTRITFTIEGVEKLRFEFDSNAEGDESEVDEDMVQALLETALSRIEQHTHTPLAEVRAARPAPLQRAVKPTQGSGSAVPGLEQVPCSSCGADVGETCRTAGGGHYYKGWGHQARISIVAPDRKRHWK